MGELSFECSLDLLKGVESNQSYLQTVVECEDGFDLIFADVDNQGNLDFSRKSLKKIYSSYRYIEDEMYKTMIAVIKKENIAKYEEIIREGNELMDKKVTVDIHLFLQILGIVCAPLAVYLYNKGNQGNSDVLYNGLTILSGCFVLAGCKSSIHFPSERKEYKVLSKIRERKLELERRRIFKKL